MHPPCAHGHAGLAAEDGLEERDRVVSAERGDFLDRDAAALKKCHRLLDAHFLYRVQYRKPRVAPEHLLGLAPSAPHCADDVDGRDV